MDNSRSEKGAVADGLQAIVKRKAGRIFTAFARQVNIEFQEPVVAAFEGAEMFLDMFRDLVEMKVYARMVADPEFRQRCYAEYEQELAAEREAAERLDEARRMGVFIHPDDQSLTR